MTGVWRRHGRAWLTLACGLMVAAPAAPAGGIGGTGVSAYGPIQRFGSVFIDGREYHLRHADIRVDGTASSRAALHLGQVALVRARRVRGALYSFKVSVRHGLQGLVTRINPNTLTVLGQRVHRGDGPLGVAWTTLRRGDVVRVSGFAAGRRAWVATRISRTYRAGQRPRSYPVWLRGVLRRGNFGQLVIRGISIHLAGARRLLGQPVRLQGVASSAGVRWTRISPDLLALGAAGTEVDMTGYVRRKQALWQQNHRALQFRGNMPRTDALATVRGHLTANGAIVVGSFQELGVERPGVSGVVRAGVPPPPALPETTEAPDLEGPPILNRPQVERPEKDQ